MLIRHPRKETGKGTVGVGTSQISVHIGEEILAIASVRLTKCQHQFCAQILVVVGHRGSASSYNSKCASWVLTFDCSPHRTCSWNEIWVGKSQSCCTENIKYNLFKECWCQICIRHIIIIRAKADSDYRQSDWLQWVSTNGHPTCQSITNQTSTMSSICHRW